MGRFILLLDDRGSNASRFGADGAAREADPYAQLQVWEELAISILRTSAGGTAVAITATPRLLEGLVLPYAEACAPVISPSAVVRELVDGHEEVARTAREIFKLAEAANDQPTADLLTQRLQIHEKTAWMLRSLLEA